MQEPNDLISVIIPTYNRSAYLIEAVESALRQEGVDLEVIVVDDGSTDDTPGAVGQHRPRWGERFLYVRQENAERSVARNNGVRHARGRYLAFLDSDDLWTECHLKTCLAALKRHPEAVAAYGEYGLIDATGRLIRDRTKQPAPARVDFAKALCLKRLILHPTRVLIRRSHVSKGDLFDPTIPGAEDWLFWVELSQSGAFIATSQRTVWMRIHPNGTFGEPFKFSSNLMAAAEKVVATGVPNELGIPAARVRAINKTHCAYAHYLSGNWPEALRHLGQAVRSRPSLVLGRDFWTVALRLGAGRALSRWLRHIRQRPTDTPVFCEQP